MANRFSSKDQAQRLWNELTPDERFEIEDQLVLGLFQWDLPGTLTAIDRLRMLWEQEIS
jgi:hypothetical protein